MAFEVVLSSESAEGLIACFCISRPSVFLHFLFVAMSCCCYEPTSFGNFGDRKIFLNMKLSCREYDYEGWRRVKACRMCVWKKKERGGQMC